MSTTHREFPGIELLRFICAFGVLVWHYQHFFYLKAGQFSSQLVPDQSVFPFRNGLLLFYTHGFGAVQVFWMISGFIFVWKYADTIFERKISGARYLVLRISRLYPLHLLTLLWVAAMQWRYHARFDTYFVYPRNDLSHFIQNLFFMGGWNLAGGFSFNGPTWSVSVEVFIYLVFFLIASAMRFNKMTSVLLAGFAFVLMRIGGLGKNFVECLMLFLLGGLIFTLTRNASAWSRRARLGLLAFALLLAAVPFVEVYGHGLVTRHIHLDVSELAYRDYFFAPAVTLLVLFVPMPRALTAISTTLGNLTYSSYLIHFPIQLCLIYLVDARGLSRKVFLGHSEFALFVGVVFAAAFLVHRYFEMPAQDYLRRSLAPLLSRRPVPAPALEGNPTSS